MSKNKQEFLDFAYEAIQKIQDTDTKEAVVKNFPVIITLGDQSSGKSSIFSRIIGKELPTKDGCCTRVPIMITTKREDGNIEIKSTLTNGRNYYNLDEDNFCEAIDLAQTNCLDGNEFSTQMVKITIYSQPYDLTFIDLPGLTARDVRNKCNPQNKVYDILENIKNNYEKSIIFHIIDANTECEKSFSIMELDEIIGGDKNRQIITIYTKTDKLENMNKFNELDKKIRGKKFIMSGIEGCDEKQPNGTNYEVGKNSVLEYLNQVNLSNIEENYILFTNAIKNKLSELDKKLKNELKPFKEHLERNKIIKETKKVLTNNFKSYFAEYKNEKENIFKKLKKLKAFQKYEMIEINDFTELKSGDIIYYWDNLEERQVKTSIIENSSGCVKFYKKYYEGCEDEDECENNLSVTTDETEEFMGKLKSSPDELYTYYYTPEKYFSNDIRFCCICCCDCKSNDFKKTKNFDLCVKWCNANNKKDDIKKYSSLNYWDCKKTCKYQDIYEDTGKFWLYLPDRNVVSEIKSILEENGELEPDIFKEHKSVLHHYLKQFANKCKEVQQNFLNKLNDIIGDKFLNQITNGEIKNIVGKIFEIMKKEAQKDIDKLHMKNAYYKLISSSNSHYLSENILRAIKNNKTLAEDDAYYKIACCKVDAFIKVASKYVIERTDEIFNLFYYLVIDKMIDNFNDYDENEFNHIENEILNPLEQLKEIYVENDSLREELRSKALNDKEILNNIVELSKKIH